MSLGVSSHSDGQVSSLYEVVLLVIHGVLIACFAVLTPYLFPSILMCAGTLNSMICTYGTFRHYKIGKIVNKKFIFCKEMAILVLVHTGILFLYLNLYCTELEDFSSTFQT